ncbi:MAG: 2-oxoacid:acceptor oxidoreductase family protein [Desulfuromonadaceae bacterium]|nr:2-oxoacid:acceptor oxidoreductase family protein [Desulfuromonadaceae bacterium]
MYRIRLHGRGGQGIKTASRILGTALFRSGFEVQDAPRYGAERRGAPIFAYVRADDKVICERGLIHQPNLVVVADETLFDLPAANVLEGLDGRAVLLINSERSAQDWCRQLQLPGQVTVLDGAAVVREAGRVPAGALCVGAAARLLGVVSRRALLQAVAEELAGHDAAAIQTSQQAVSQAYELFAGEAGLVQRLQSGAKKSVTTPPKWVELDCEALPRAAPTITMAATSALVKTGLWRTRRPRIDRALCSRCGLCRTLCPEGGIDLDGEGYPVIDYRYCKGCLLCAAQCPRRAIAVADERTVSPPQPKEGEP